MVEVMCETCGGVKVVDACTCELDALREELLDYQTDDDEDLPDDREEEMSFLLTRLDAAEAIFTALIRACPRCQGLVHPLCERCAPLQDWLEEQ